MTHVALGDPSACDKKDAVRISKVVVHPEYRAGRAYADLAVVKLAQSLDLTHFFPTCLNTPSDVAVRPGLRANAASWNMRGTCKGRCSLMR